MHKQNFKVMCPRCKKSWQPNSISYYYKCRYCGESIDLRKIAAPAEIVEV